MYYNRGSSQQISAALIIGGVVGLIVGILIGYMISAPETQKTSSIISYSYDCNCERSKQDVTESCFITHITASR